MIPARTADSLVIAKWTYGSDRASVVTSLRDVRLDAFPRTGLAFTFRSSPQVLFDSACAGNQVRESLTARLPAGDYVASTLVFKPSRDIALVLHWARPLARQSHISKG